MQCLFVLIENCTGLITLQWAYTDSQYLCVPTKGSKQVFNSEIYDYCSEHDTKPLLEVLITTVTRITTLHIRNEVNETLIRGE